MSQPPRAAKLVRFLAALVSPSALFALAFAMRALPWRLVFDGERVYFFGNDAYYHARRVLFSVAHFPSVLVRDPYINFPHGGEPIWSPLFDLTSAFGVRLFGVADDVRATEQLLVWIPPLLGAATAVLAFLVARRHFGRAAGWIGGAFAALLPAQTAYSQIGFLDHHAAVSFLGLALLALGMGLLSAGRHSWPRRARFALGSGFLAGSSLLLWPGMILEVAILGAGLLGWALATARTEEVRARVGLVAAVHFVAFAIVSPFAWGRSWEVWGSFTPVVLSSFQPWLLACLAVGHTLLFLALARTGDRVSWRRRLTMTGVCGGAVLVVGGFLAGDLLASLEDAFAWFARRESFQAEVLESRPLLAQGWRVAANHLSGFMLLTPLLFFQSLRRLRRPKSVAGERAAAKARDRARDPRLLLVAWTFALSLATLFQTRFMSSLAPVLAVFLAAELPRFSREALAWLRERRPGWGGGSFAVLVAIGGLLLLPSLTYYRSDLENQARGWRGEAPLLPKPTQRRRQLIQVAEWIRDHTDETSGYLDADAAPEYAVMSHWSDGHVIEYFAHRPTVVDNFGDDLGHENFALAEEYYQADEARSSEILDQTGARFVIMEFRPIATRRPAGPRSMLSRLYFRDGSYAPDSVRVGHKQLQTVEGEVSAVERYRLVHESAPKPWAPPPHRAAFKVYEHVLGAVLRGRTLPNAEVTARLSIETHLGRRFDFVSVTKASAAGEYRLRFPYATEGNAYSTRTGSSVMLESLGQRRRVRISEADVLEGRFVPVPAFPAQTDAPR